MKFLNAEIRELENGVTVLILGGTLEIILDCDLTPEEKQELLAAPPLPPTVCPQCGHVAKRIVERAPREWPIRELYYNGPAGRPAWTVVAGEEVEADTVEEVFLCSKCGATWYGVCDIEFG